MKRVTPGRLLVSGNDAPRLRYLSFYQPCLAPRAAATARRPRTSPLSPSSIKAVAIASNMLSGPPAAPQPPALAVEAAVVGVPPPGGVPPVGGGVPPPGGGVPPPGGGVPGGGVPGGGGPAGAGESVSLILTMNMSSLGACGITVGRQSGS